MYCKIQYNRHFASKNVKIGQKTSRKTEFRSNMFRSCLSGTVLGPTLGPLSPQWSRSGGPLGPLKASLGALWRPLGSISGPWAPFAVSFLHQTFTPQASICIGGGKPATYYLLLLYPGQAECAKRLNPPHPAGVLNPYRSLKSHPCRVDSSTPPFFPPPRAPRIARSRGRRCFFFVFFWSLLVRHVWPRLCIPFRTPLGLFWTSFSSHFGFIFGRKLVLETAFRFFNDFLKLLSNTFIFCASQFIKNSVFT